MRCRYRSKQSRTIKEVNIGKKDGSGLVMSSGMFVISGFLAGFVYQLKCS